MHTIEYHKTTIQIQIQTTNKWQTLTTRECIEGGTHACSLSPVRHYSKTILIRLVQNIINGQNK